jgi:putative membrane protein
MTLVSQILIGFIAFIHFYFLILEMFLWTTRGKKVFTQFPDDFFEKTKLLAANQGLYNGFLAAGLVWSLLISNGIWSTNVALFFLSCIVIAGIYGSVSVSKRIFYAQAIPAIIAIISLFF